VSTPKILVFDRSDALADQVAAVAEQLDPVPEVHSCTRVGSVNDVIDESGPFSVIVAGPSLSTKAGLARLERIRRQHPSTSVVLAFSKRPEASLKEIVRAGAVDLLQVPVADEDLVEALDAAMVLSQDVGDAASPSAQPVPAPAPGGPGRVFTISSATGGCGKTFFATNLAYFLARHTAGRVCIVDLDLQFGEVSTALRLRPRYTISDALERDDTDEEDLRNHIEEYLVPHETGVFVLAAPKDPAEADRITPPDATRIIEAVRSRFEWVIVDTPAQLSEIVLAAFDMSETLFSLATLDLPSVRNMSVFLTTLEKLKIDTQAIKLILNKEEHDVGIDVAQVEKLFPQGFASIFPYAKEVSRSINLGVPVLASSPTSEISRRLSAGMIELLPPADRAKAEAAQPAPKGGLRRLFRRSD
jgi:pilus assembly protein CpaE